MQASTDQSQIKEDLINSRCTAPDFLDTSIAILDPTCGSPRSTIIVPEPMLCALFSRPPSDLPDGLSPPCAHAAADGLRKSRRT